MRTSLNEIKEIDDYLSSHMQAEDRLLFEARLLLDPQLNDRVLWQKKAYGMVRQYSRNQLKAEIERVHDQLFHTAGHRSFREKIMRLFNKPG